MAAGQDKVAVVTGAGSGIGRALAGELASRGFALALSDVDEAGLAVTAKQLADAGHRVHTSRVDVADRDAVFAHADEVLAELGRVDVVINNAGVALNASVREQSHADLRFVLDVDFWGVVHGTEAFLPALIDSGRGHLTNISSLFGLVGVPKQSAYAAAKFAVRGYTETLRQEMVLERQPVQVHCVHPGGVRTDIARSARTGPSEDPDETAKLFDVVARTSPEAAARAIVKGMQRGKGRILVGADARVLGALPRLLGNGYQTVIRPLLGAQLYRRS